MKERNYEFMGGIDALFASSLEKIILENLGESTFKKIQDRLFEKFGISMTTAMAEFEKIDSVLREFFGAGAEGLEKKFLENICSITSKQNEAEMKFTISDLTISKKIIDAFGDEEMSKILNSSIGEPWTILEMVEKLNIPKTSGYRKAHMLIDAGLLVPVGYEFTANRRRIEKYKSLFDNVQIDFNRNVVVNVQFTPEIAEKSSVLKTVYG